MNPANREKKVRHFRGVAAALLLMASLPVSGLAANPNAGLPANPEYTNSNQLESAFQNLQPGALTAQPEKGLPPAPTEPARRTPEGGSRLGLPGSQNAAPEMSPQETCRLLELAAEQGDLAAARQLAWIYEYRPPGGTVNTELALYWLSFAASKGYLPACAGLGWSYISPVSLVYRKTEPDYAQAERWFKKGAEGQDAGCELGMAMLLLLRDKKSPDLAEARKWLLKAAAQEFVPAFYQLGRLSELRELAHAPSVQPDYEEAVRWYRRGAEAGHRGSAARLAELMIAGKTGTRSEAIEALRLASDLGDLNARVELAMRYAQGEGTPREAGDSALALLESACALGSGRAMVQLSDLYRTGTLVKRDPIQAIHLLVQGAARRNPQANERLMQLRSEPGDAAPQDPTNLTQALADYKRAVYNSNPEGALLLARRYEDGTYPADKFRAAVWYSFAAGRKDASAAAQANRLADALDPAARQRIEKEVRVLFTNSQFRLYDF